MGLVHLSHVVSTLRFGDEVKNQISIIRDFPEESNRIRYINSLENELTRAVDYSSARKVNAPIESILVNGFIGQFEGKIWTFSISSADFQKKADFYAKRLLLKELIDRLYEKTHFCKDKLSYDKATFFVDHPPDSEIFDFMQRTGLYYIEEPRQILIEELEQSLLEYLIAKIIETNLLSQRLVKIGNELKFIDFSSAKIEIVSAGQDSIPLKLYYGFTLRINKMNGGKFLLWIDPTYMQFYTIDKWIESSGTDSASGILREINTVDVLPNKKPGTLVKIDLDEPIPQSIKEFWKNKYKLNIMKSKGMAKVKFDVGKDYDYPIETLCLGRKWIEKNIGFLMLESPAMSPPERLNETEKWFRLFFKKPFEERFARITFSSNLSSLKDLGEIFRSSYEIVPPILVFSKKDIDKRGTDTRAIFKFGGYAGNKSLIVFRVICPGTVSDHDIEDFLVALKRTYDSLFGTLNISTKDVRIAYPDVLLRDSLPKIEENLRRKIGAISVPTKGSIAPICIVVDSQQHAFYYITKSIINEMWQIPDQHLKLRTFDRILRRDLPLLRGFALQLYLKSLNSEEAPWILRYPSDGTAKTVYCGIGFSMQVKESGLRKSIGVLAICDAQGKFIYQKHLSLSDVSNYLTEELLQKLFSFITEKSFTRTFERLVIYRKGHLKPEEKSVVEKYLIELKQSETWHDKNVDVITVEDEIYRLFETRDGSVINVNSGTVVEFNEKESLICVSGHPDTGLRHGTAKLMHLQSEICESSKTIFELSREYYDRTFLNWMAPVTLSKYPPELNISQNIAEITKEVDINKDFTYLQV